MLDNTKALLFVALITLVLLLVSNGKRPTASAPLDGDTAVEGNETAVDQSDIAPTWALNVPRIYPHPLALMMPKVGGSPVVS